MSQIIGQSRLGRGLASAVEYMEKDRPGALLSQLFCVAFAGHLHNLFTPQDTLLVGDGETESGGILGD